MAAPQPADAVVRARRLCAARLLHAAGGQPVALLLGKGEHLGVCTGYRLRMSKQRYLGHGPSLTYIRTSLCVAMALRELTGDQLAEARSISTGVAAVGGAAIGLVQAVKGPSALWIVLAAVVAVATILAFCLYFLERKARKVKFVPEGRVVPRAE